jgi:hypothetical protein
MLPTGFTPSVSTYDPIGKRIELEALAAETDSKGLDYESNKPLLAIRDEIRKKILVSKLEQQELRH